MIICYIFILACINNKTEAQDTDVHKLWIECKLEGIISFDLFKSAVLGQKQINNLTKKSILTIIDYSKPSSEKRFYVVDVENKHLIYRCLVAHGKNSGLNYAKIFSNEPESLESSLGFFLTSETYYGDNGYSLRLIGLEKGINDNAGIRQMVIHGASYVSEDFIKKNGRLGRSWGCPALPLEISKEIIDKISVGSCIYIYAENTYYKENSVFIKDK